MQSESVEIVWRYECHLCSSWFRRRSNLRRHLETVEKLTLNASDIVNKNYPVPHAGKKYRQDKLKNISAMLICLLCMKVIGTKKDLRQHLETAHEIQGNKEKGKGWSTDTETWNTESDYVDSEDEDAALTEDSLEEQFRSEFSEVEYSGGNAAKEQNIELAMEKDDIYKRVQMIVQKTRQSLSQKKNLLHPMRYGVVDLTKRHAPSHLVLQPWYEWLQNDFYKQLTYRRHEISEKEKRLILALEEDAVTDQEKLLKLLGQICDFHGEHASEVASEHTHIIYHFAHFMNFAELKGQQWRAQWGETTLTASSERRNKSSDPEVRARIGQRCDYLLTYKGHAIYPEVLIGEVSGGIPATANWKTWYDFLIKLVLGSRDCILRIIERCGEQGKTSVMYSFQLSGFRLTVYAVGFFHGMWRVMMLDECFLPSGNEDKESRIKVYSILKGLMEAARTEAHAIRRILNSDAYGLEQNYESFYRKRQTDDDIFVIDSPKKKIETFSP